MLLLSLVLLESWVLLLVLLALLWLVVVVVVVVNMNMYIIIVINHIIMKDYDCQDQRITCKDFRV